MKKRVTIVSTMLLFCGAVFATQDLHWGGASTGTWGVGLGGWKLPDGTDAVFQAGDNVTLTNAPSAVTLTLVGNFPVGNFLFNSDVQYTLKPTTRTTSSTLETMNGTITEAASFTKLGAGKLVFNNFTGSWTCDMDFLQGAFEVTKGSVAKAPALDLVSSPFGSLLAPKTITVGTGDTTRVPTLNLSTMNDQYVLTVGPAETIPLTFVLDAGTILGVQYACMMVTDGPVTLRNGSVIWEQTWFRDSIHVQRSLDGSASTKSEIKCSRAAFAHSFGTTNTAPFVITVDDVTAEDPTVGDSKNDLELNGSALTDVEKNGVVTHQDFVKRGKGRMSLNATSSSFTGDVTVEDGVLYVATQAQVGGLKTGVLGNSYTNRTISIVGPGALELGRAESFARVFNETPTLRLVLTNATVSTSGYNSFGNLEMYGTAKINSTGVTNGRSVFGFSEYTLFALDEPYSIPCQNLNGHNIHLDYRREKVATEQSISGFSEICVRPARLHEDTFIDVALSHRIRDHIKEENTSDPLQYYCGLIKTGAGVLALNNVNAYRNDTRVEAGGLWLGRPVANSTIRGTIATNVVASKGGVVGGEGRIKGNWVIEEGGGFLVDATDEVTQAKALTVDGSVSLPQVGLVRLYGVEETDPMAIHFEGLPLPNTSDLQGLDSVNAGRWRVEVDGFDARETRNLKVFFNEVDNTYDIRYHQTGTHVLIR